ncbi:MAG: 6-phosphofructokinase [Planctomycetes bacterium]|nr:6-phosphofructokinase [Planctomycetota bacterium]
MTKKIGVLTGGGDCPGLNAAIRAVMKSGIRQGWDVVGIRGGFEGLLAPGDAKPLTYENTSGILTMGGTILGSANRGHFSAKAGAGEKRGVPAELIKEAQDTMRSLGITALIVIGGDGTLSIAQQFYEAGTPVVGIPKTIDNDLQATVVTFGFDSAVACATDALDRLHTTAESHNRIIVLEVMGRWAGWIAVHAGIAGGGDIILIPEIPFSYDAIVQQIDRRERMGRRFTLVVVAEGAREKGAGYVAKESGSPDREMRLGGIGERVAGEIQRRTGKETRTVVLGHLQRGGGPTTFDRLLATRYGAFAVQMVIEGNFGKMAALAPPDVVAVPITEAIGRIRTVPPDGNVVRTARALGISLGAPEEVEGGA